jgi:hypothetical protein
MSGAPTKKESFRLLKQFGRSGTLGATPDLRSSSALAPPPPPPAPPTSSEPLRLTDLHLGQTVAPPGLGTKPDDVHQPGGEGLFKFQHPDFQTVEELYRILPDDSWFQPSVGPGNPIQFEIGSFTVPNSQQYWLFDYEFSIFRFSGVDAGDFLKAEAGRFSGVMGFDVTIDGRRPSHLLYQLDPQPAQIQKQSFLTFNAQGATNNNSAFNRSTAQSFAATASQGTSVLPVRRMVQGAGNVPFTFIAQQQAKVALSVIIFKRIKSPIAAIEARHGGYLMQSSLSQALQIRMRPR